MAEIHVLDHATIDKIAAGEVVERPASVAKELVENAIDAGAGSITVETKEGGTTFLRVTDNGTGIAGTQVDKAFLRHATSKILKAEDLLQVTTLGFRGEALASIAAVSMVEMVTKQANDLTGTRYVIEGGMEKAKEEVGAPDGTTLIVRNLFYNVPARKKFLKKPQTEGSYISDLMEHMALSHPEVAFRFIQNGKVQFSTSGNGNLKEVIYRIFGKDLSDNIKEVSFSDDALGLTVKGFIGVPGINRSNRNYEIFFINDRFIKSKILSAALEEGFREYLMQHKFPVCILHLYFQPGMVDVNVHPTKMEVRISDSQTIYEFIAKQIHLVLSNQEMIPAVSPGKTEHEKPKAEKKQDLPELFELNRIAKEHMVHKEQFAQYTGRASAQSGIKQPSIKERSFSYDFTNPEPSEKQEASSQADVARDDGQILPQSIDMASEQETGQDSVVIEAQPSEDLSNQSYATDQPNAATEQDRSATEQDRSATEQDRSATEQARDATGQDIDTLGQDRDTTDRGIFGNGIATQNEQQLSLFGEKIISKTARDEYQIIGQIFKTYWLVTYRDQLLIIDQHAAHEKVKYERFIKQMDEHLAVSQNLNPPVVVTLQHAEAALFEENRSVFEEMGFTLEHFGGNEYTLRTVPMELYGAKPDELLLDILEDIQNQKLSRHSETIRNRIATMACKAAVKGNQNLSRPEMEALLDELLTLDNPYHCPHGRPTIITMSQNELEKKFKRIV